MVQIVLNLLNAFVLHHVHSRTCLYLWCSSRGYNIFNVYRALVLACGHARVMHCWPFMCTFNILARLHTRQMALWKFITGLVINLHTNREAIKMSKNLRVDLIQALVEIAQLHKRLRYTSKLLRINDLFCRFPPGSITASRCFSLQVCLTSGQVCLPSLSTSPSEPFFKEVPPSNASHWTRKRPELAYFNLIGWGRCSCKSGSRLWWGVRWNSRCEEKEGSKKKKSSFEFSGMIFQSMHILIRGNFWQKKPTLEKMKSLKYRLKKHEVTITVSETSRFFLISLSDSLVIFVISVCWWYAGLGLPAFLLPRTFKPRLCSLGAVVLGISPSSSSGTCWTSWHGFMNPSELGFSCFPCPGLNQD